MYVHILPAYKAFVLEHTHLEEYPCTILHLNEYQRNAIMSYLLIFKERFKELSNSCPKGFLNFVFLPKIEMYPFSNQDDKEKILNEKRKIIEEVLGISLL